MLEKNTLYASFCEKYEAVLPLCFQPWWLDAAVGPHEWHGMLLHDNTGNPIGIWPVHTRRKWRLPYHTLPYFTLYNGPWFVPECTPDSAFLKKIMARIPPALYHIVHPRYAPFSIPLWQAAGFQAEWRQSYLLPANVPAPILFDGFQSSTKSRIRKAQTLLTLRNDVDFQEFEPLCQSFFTLKGLGSPIAFDALRHIVTRSKERRQGQLWCAFDKEQRLVAGIVVVWGAHTTYCIVTATDPAYRHLNAPRLLLWQAIQDAANRGHAFDFEGGDVPGIGDFFASFGAVRTPYIRAIRYPNAAVRYAVQGLKWLASREALFRM